MSQVFERIIVVMFENQYRHYLMQDPFLQRLAAAGADMRNYFGCFHPSQTNYLASFAGEVCGVTNDTPPAAPLPQQTLVDLLEAGGVSWRAYMEGYPGQAWNPAWARPDYPAELQPLPQYPQQGPQLARYFRKHNAFASFHSVQRSAERWANIVDDARFWQDLHDGRLPQYSWFTPDIWNDGHYLYNTHAESQPRTRMIGQISNWLEYVFLGDIDATQVQGAPAGVPRLGLGLDFDLLQHDPQAAWRQSRLPQGTLVVITFDEADFNARGYDTSYDGPNQIYTVLLGDMIEPGSAWHTPCNHYGLMRTVQRNWGLASLGKNDAAANPIRSLWRETFAWQPATDTGLAAGPVLALAATEQELLLVTTDTNNELMFSHCNGGPWEPLRGLGLSCDSDAALAVIGDELLLVYGDGDGLHCCSRSHGGWSATHALEGAYGGSLALAAFTDPCDGSEQAMLCWRCPAGFIHYRSYRDGFWGEPGEVGQLTDGRMALGQIGTSLLLVYKQRNTRELRVTSFNLAPFNAFNAVDFKGDPAPHNDTSLRRWSAADMPVGHFHGKLDATRHLYLSLGRPVMAPIDGELHLVFRGAYDDTPGLNSCFFGLNGLFTATDPLSNGYGTLRQAGWTEPQPLAGCDVAPDAAVALCAQGEELVLVWKPQGAATLSLRRAGYGGG